MCLCTQYGRLASQSSWDISSFSGRPSKTKEQVILDDIQSACIHTYVHKTMYKHWHTYTHTHGGGMLFTYLLSETRSSAVMQGGNAQTLPHHSHFSNLPCTISRQAWNRFQIDYMVSATYYHFMVDTTPAVYYGSWWTVFRVRFWSISSTLAWGKVIVTGSLFTCLLALLPEEQANGASTSSSSFFLTACVVSVFIWNYTWSSNHH